jgi:hypothetical protein
VVQLTFKGLSDGLEPSLSSLIPFMSIWVPLPAAREQKGRRSAWAHRHKVEQQAVSDCPVQPTWLDASSLSVCGYLRPAC